MAARNHTLKDQAAYLTQNFLEIGMSRRDAARAGKICSYGTARSYRSAIRQFLKYLQVYEICKARRVDRSIAIRYLHHRADSVGQKTLDLDRQAISLIFNLDLPYLLAKIQPKNESRAITHDQVKLLMKRQQFANRLATEICFATGIRAHELATISHRTEQPRSTNRDWSEYQFYGLEEDYAVYTVAGKGGLVREIALPIDLANRLEEQKLVVPVRIVDREITYTKRYAIALGQAWSESFGRASVAALGWSKGAHSLRHSFAQRRMRTLMTSGFPFDDALAIVATEMGHFRPEITLEYLR